MAVDLSESSTFSGTITVPEAGDNRTAASVLGAFQALTNRTRQLKNRCDGAEGQLKSAAQLQVLSGGASISGPILCGNIVSNGTIDTSGNMICSGLSAATVACTSLTASGHISAASVGTSGNVEAQTNMVAQGEVYGQVGVWTVGWLYGNSLEIIDGALIGGPLVTASPSQIIQRIGALPDASSTIQAANFDLLYALPSGLTANRSFGIGSTGAIDGMVCKIVNRSSFDAVISATDSTTLTTGESCILARIAGAWRIVDKIEA